MNEFLKEYKDRGFYYQSTDDKEKLSGYLKLGLGTRDFQTEINNNDVKISLKKEIPKEVEERLSKKITELIPGIKQVEFAVTKNEKNK